MKASILTLIILLTSLIGNTQEFLKELETSVERSDGGSGAIVEYQIYLTPSNMKMYVAKDFDKGLLVKEGGVPKYFELSKKSGEEKEVFVINLEKASVYELEVENVKGKIRYRYKFYY